MPKRKKRDDDDEGKVVVLFADHFREEVTPHPVSDDDTTIVNSGQVGGRRKSTRERRGTNRWDPLQVAEFADPSGLLILGEGFLCPNCNEVCAYDASICDECHCRVCYVPGVGARLISSGTLANNAPVEAPEAEVPDEETLMDDANATDDEQIQIEELDTETADATDDDTTIPPAPSSLPHNPPALCRVKRRRASHVQCHQVAGTDSPNPDTDESDDIGLLQNHRPEDALLMNYYRGGLGTEIVAKYDTISICRSSMCVLRAENGWIDDQVIDLFGHAFLRSSANNAHVRIWYYECNFMNQLLGADGMSFNFNEVEASSNIIAEIGEGGSVYDLDHLFVPINVGNSHWIFLHVQPKEKTVKLYDSYGVYRNTDAHRRRRVKNQRYLTAMNRYLYMLISEGFDGPPEDVKLWTTVNDWTFSDASNCSPIQLNGYDCGVFIIVSMYLLSKGHVLTDQSYSQQLITNAKTRLNIASLIHEVNVCAPAPPMVAEEQMDTQVNIVKDLVAGAGAGAGVLGAVAGSWPRV